MVTRDQWSSKYIAPVVHVFCSTPEICWKVLILVGHDPT